MWSTNFDKYFSTVYFNYAGFFENSTTYVVKPEQLPDMFRDVGLPFRWNGLIPTCPIDYENWILLLIQHSGIQGAKKIGNFVEFSEFHSTVVNYVFDLVFDRLNLRRPQGLIEMMVADGTPFPGPYATEVVPKDFNKYFTDVFYRFANYDEGCRSPTVNRVQLASMFQEVSLPFHSHAHTIPSAGIDCDTWMYLVVEHSHAEGCKAMMEILHFSEYDPYIVNFVFEKIFHHFNKPYPEGINFMSNTNC